MRPVSRLAQHLRGQKRRPPSPAWRRIAVRIVLPLVAVAALLGSFGYWAWRTGAVEETKVFVARANADAQRSVGLVLREVAAEGRNRTDSEELARALAVFMNLPILGVDIEAARMQLERLPWVRSASVRRQLPDVLLAHLEEYRPLALWQERQGGPVRLIDEDGTVIAISDLRPFRDLPLVRGAGAAKQAKPFLGMLAEEPELAARVTAASRIGDRRWDVVMDGRVAVQLPAQDPAAAWKRLAQHERKSRVLDRAIEAIDLRMPDRLVLRLMDEPKPAPAVPSAAAKGGRGA